MDVSYCEKEIEIWSRDPRGTSGGSRGGGALRHPPPPPPPPETLAWIRPCVVHDKESALLENSFTF